MRQKVKDMHAIQKEKPRDSLKKVPLPATSLGVTPTESEATMTIDDRWVTQATSYNVGDRVVLNNDKKGEILFVGRIEGSVGKRYGIEMKENVGGHDGTW